MFRANPSAFFVVALLVLSTAFAQNSPTAPAPPPAQSTPPDHIGTAPPAIILKSGTPVSLKLGQTLNSKTAKIGDPVEFILDQDLQVDNLVLVRKGARVLGTVTQVTKTGAVGKGGGLEIELRYLKAQGRRIKLRGDEAGATKRNTGAVVAKTVFFGLSGLLSKGKEFVIAQGSLVTAYVDEDVELPPVS